MTDQIVPPINYFFRFPSETIGRQVLSESSLLDSDEQYILSSHTHALDVIGTIVRGGEWDEDGNVITPPEVLQGWHVNYRGHVPEQMKQYAVYPQNPYRLFL